MIGWKSKDVCDCEGAGIFLAWKPGYSRHLVSYIPRIIFDFGLRSDKPHSFDFAPGFEYWIMMQVSMEFLVCLYKTAISMHFACGKVHCLLKWNLVRGVSDQTLFLYVAWKGKQQKESMVEVKCEMFVSQLSRNLTVWFCSHIVSLTNCHFSL